MKLKKPLKNKLFTNLRKIQITMATHKNNSRLSPGQQCQIELCLDSLWEKLHLIHNQIRQQTKETSINYK